MTSKPALQDPDGFLELWQDAHKGLSEADSARLNARLVLLLAHRVGDDAAVAEYLRAAAAA
jgi:hypothetical protein